MGSLLSGRSTSSSAASRGARIRGSALGCATLTGVCKLPESSLSLKAGRITSQPNTPTHVRWRVVVFLAITAGLTYIDRLNLGVAGKYIQVEFTFDTQTMGWILGPFSFGYALFHVPAVCLPPPFPAPLALP